MQRSSLSALAAICLSLLTSCVGTAGAAGAAGVYQLDKAALKDALLAGMPAEARQEKMAMDMIDGMVKCMSATVELKADGSATFDMKIDVAGKATEDKATGTWKLDGSNLAIVIKDKDGKVESKTAAYSNGSFSIEENDGGRKVMMTFRRK